LERKTEQNQAGKQQDAGYMDYRILNRRTANDGMKDYITTEGGRKKF
jgi:hypothetical protein